MISSSTPHASTPAAAPSPSCTIALGHAFGATGAVVLANVVDELERTGGRYGIAAVSVAAGLAAATLVERVSAC